MPQSAPSSGQPRPSGPPNFALRRAFLVVLALLVCVVGAATVRWAHRGGLRHYLALRQAEAPVVIPASLKDAPHWDVFVAGGTPSGIAAALSAARRGSKVLLVESRAQLGGDIVYAMLNMFDIPVDSRTQASPMAKGIFGQFYKQLGMAFNIDKAKRIMTDAVMKNPNITLRMNTRVTKVYVAQKHVIGAALVTESGAPQDITFATCIDATNDADVAALAGAKFDIGREAGRPDKLMQSVGLLFSVKHCDWRAVAKYVRSGRNVPYAAVKTVVDHPHSSAIDIDVHRSSNGAPPKTALIREGGLVFNYAWERGDIIQNYVPRGPDILICSINFGNQGDSIVLNTVNILGVNGLLPASREEARSEAVKELPTFVAYLRKNMPGFEHAEVDQIAPELYIRETRHLHGVYMLTAPDVIKGKRFWDRIAMASYPLDLHPYRRGEANPYGPQRYYYTLPLRVLLPRDLDGIFVASRSLSATWTAAGSARVIPVTMAAGEGAGAAANLCARDHVSPHELVRQPALLEEVQQSLRHFGLDIGDKYPPKHPSHNETLLAHQPHYSVAHGH